MAWIRRKVETRTSAAWHKRAKAVLADATASPNRSPIKTPAHPRYFDTASGAWLEDVDGNRYVDLVGAGGSAVLGHSDPRVIEAVRQTAQLGLTMGAPCMPPVLLAERICERLGHVEKVQFTPSHTTATELAIRLARAHTDRRTVVAFSGCFHGSVEGLLPASNPRATTAGTSPAERAAAAIDGDVLVLPYGDAGLVAAAFAREAAVAAVIVEATPAHMGVIPPPIGFNAQLAKLSRDHGALLIEDETLTGFRVSPTGMHGLEGAKEGWQPDLVILGQIIGGGLGLAAVGGPAAPLESLAARGDFDHASYEYGRFLAATAGLATLTGCDAELYARLGTASGQIQELIDQELDAAGVPHQVQAVGSVFSVHFSKGPVTSSAQAAAVDFAHYRTFATSLLDGGVFVPPSPFEPWLVSGAHDARAIEHIAAALPAAARATAKAATSVKPA